MAGNQPDPARRRMEQDGVAFPDLVDLANEVLHGQAFEHHRRGLLVGDAGRQHHQPVGRHHALLAIGAKRPAGIGDAIAGLDVGDALTDLLDPAGGLGAEAAWQRHGIEPSADIDINEVEPDGGVPHTCFAGARFADRYLFPRQHFRSAGLVEADSLGHRGLLQYVEGLRRCFRLRQGIRV